MHPSEEKRLLEQELELLLHAIESLTPDQIRLAEEEDEAAKASCSFVDDDDDYDRGERGQP